jgi:hypothetical protein
MADDQTTAAAQSEEKTQTAAYADYVHDQLQQSRTTTDHGAVLRKRAPARIAASRAAIEKALQAHSGQKDSGQEGSPAASLDQYHAVERMLDEQAFYPPHDKRTESPAYAEVHHQMTVADDKHCLVCGVRHSTLGDINANPFGAVQMETHHHTIEWALANAIDETKFNQHILPGLAKAAAARAQNPAYASESPLYKAFDADYASGHMGIDRIKAWVDHGADNLWVLCDIHHRHKFVGIHAISYPIWGPQDVVDSEIVEREINAAKSTKANT